MQSTPQMNYNQYRTNLVTVSNSDSDFYLTDGIITAQRAAFIIDEKCPTSYKMILMECINKKWLKPVATMYDYEKTYSRLKS